MNLIMEQSEQGENQKDSIGSSFAENEDHSTNIIKNNGWVNLISLISENKDLKNSLHFGK